MLKIIDQVDARRKSDRNIVRNIRFQPTVDQAVQIILASDWDFRDHRHILYGDPDYHRNFLKALAEGRAMSLQEMHPKMSRLLCAIVDAWLRNN